MSLAIKALEERLGVRLLSRTRRAVPTTEAGETPAAVPASALDDIASGVDAVGASRGKPSAHRGREIAGLHATTASSAKPTFRTSAKSQ